MAWEMAGCRWRCSAPFRWDECGSAQNGFE